VSARARLDVNVALNRPAYQVSIYSDHAGSYPASYANDGNDGTDMYNGGTCIHTNSATNPWWAVDLGVALYVYGVKFSNRGDGSGKFVRSLHARYISENGSAVE